MTMMEHYLQIGFKNSHMNLFMPFPPNEVAAEENNNRFQHSFGSFNFGNESSQNSQPPQNEEEHALDPIDTSFDTFIQGGHDPITPMSSPG